MSTDNGNATDLPSLLGFRPERGMFDRLTAWRKAYAARNCVALESVKWQLALPYLLNLALAAEGFPQTDGDTP